MQSGFFLLQRKNGERKEIVGGENYSVQRDSMIWETHSIWVAKDRKLGDSLSESMLWRETKGVPEQPLANIAEDPKFRAFDHTEGL